MYFFFVCCCPGTVVLSKLPIGVNACLAHSSSPHVAVSIQLALCCLIGVLMVSTCRTVVPKIRIWILSLILLIPA
ncbi:MAG: hypothetical protein JOS17DRAFT_762472 [Linnemannia elongata]|nr:MAG: hypothetical protein JOS17DRAFT_762472 [Linnemannia elongata]